MDQGVVPLREAVAEAMYEKWCERHKKDFAWNADAPSKATRNFWIEMADTAIAAIEYDFMIVERGEVIRP